MKELISIKTFINDDIFNDVYLSGIIQKPNKNDIYYLNGEYFISTKIKTIKNLYLPICLSTKFSFDDYKNIVFLKGKISNRFYNFVGKNNKKNRNVKNYIFINNLIIGNRQHENINQVYLKGKLIKKNKLINKNNHCMIKSIILINNNSNKRETIPVLFYDKEALYINSLDINDEVNIIGEIKPDFYDSNKFIIKNHKTVMTKNWSDVIAKQ